MVPIHKSFAQQAAILIRKLLGLLGLTQIHRQWLLTEHMLTGLHTLCDPLQMEGMQRRDIHRIHLRIS